MSHSQFHSIDLFILRHAWLNLWDKRMLLAESTRLLSLVTPTFSRWTKSGDRHQDDRRTKPHSQWCWVARRSSGVFPRWIRVARPDDLNELTSATKYTWRTLSSHIFDFSQRTGGSHASNPSTKTRHKTNTRHRCRTRSWSTSSRIIRTGF